MKKDTKHNIVAFFFELCLCMIALMIGLLVLGVIYNNLLAIILGAVGICVFAGLSILLYFVRPYKKRKRKKFFPDENQENKSDY